jgi:polysaccharide biosynthesis transport protein
LEQPEKPLHLATIPHAAAKSLTVPTDVLDACRAVCVKIGAPRLASLGVTSALRGEGRSLIAAALALVQLEDYRRRVVLVEMDLERPSIADQLGLDGWPGLVELASGQASLQEAIRSLPNGMSVITAGTPSTSPARLMTEVLSSGVLRQIGQSCDVVVADLPPVLGSSMGPSAVEAFDRLVLVVRAGVTPLGRVREAIATLGSEPALVLNGTSSTLPRWLRQILHV